MVENNETYNDTIYTQILAKYKYWILCLIATYSLPHKLETAIQ